MKVMKRIVSQLHSFVLWLLISALFWSWVFTFVTDAPAGQKITVYCKVPALRATELAVALEEDMPEGLRMIQVRSFDYVMFDVEAFYQGDLFIVPASEAETYADALGPDPVPVAGAAASYITYGDEDYWLYLGSGSVHLEDGKALAVARRLLELQ